eukprot:gene7747-9530_t
MQQILINKEFYQWVLPLVRGYVEIFNFFLEGNSFEYAIISRRSKFRAGTRYNTRGSDLLGNVANYVETEQILHSTDGNGRKTFSFTQTRGSIPLIWEQTGMKIKPLIKINSDTYINNTSFKLHFNEQINLYGSQTIVSLLDQRGSEAELGDSYRQALDISNLSSVNFVGFDFHQYCQGNRFDRVDILINNLEERIEQIGFLERDSFGIQTFQEGNIRTNCLDCLDRTNLVQSMIGIKVLENQLRKLGIEWNAKDPSHPISKQIKLAWANNGDAISLQYAGTQALKGDFTRTGKRNTKGVFKDGVNSLTRYYINTFLDKIRQVSIDLFLGIITVETNTYKLIQKEYDWGESRMNAINNCVDHFLRSEQGDGFINAWIVISINKRNQEQERILLLTPTHLVRCKYNFNENKIVHFKQTLITNIKKIQKGTMLTENGKNVSYGFKIFSKGNVNNSKSNNNNNNNNNRKISIKASKNINIENNNSNNGEFDNNNNNNGNGNYNSIGSESFKDDTNQLLLEDVSDCICNQYIVPIPDGETIDFAKDLVSEIADSIKECYSNQMGYADINQLNCGSTFIIEQDFKRKTNSFVSAAYNSLKLGFYSKSPTVGSKGSFSKLPLSNSSSNTSTISNNNNNDNWKRRSKSFDASTFTNNNCNEWDPYDRTLK